MTERPTAADRYIETMGREPPPPVAEDEPLAWQWDYTSTKENRERLRSELSDELAEDGEQPEQETSLF